MGEAEQGRVDVASTRMEWVEEGIAGYSLVGSEQSGGEYGKLV